MKNEELFDMLAEFKVNDEYIEDALIGASDVHGEKVYAAIKPRKSPMKIIASVAACLAVFAAAGLVVANVGRLSAKPDNSASASTSTDEDKIDYITDEFDSRHENSNTESTATGYLDTAVWSWGVPSQTEYVEMGKSLISAVYARELQGDVTWQKGDLDIDHDNVHELLLCPQINGKSVKGVGVCVFKKFDAKSDPVYIGSFGADVDTMDLGDFQLNWSNDTDVSYYFTHSEENEKCVVGVQKLYIENNAVCDDNYLRLATDYPSDASSDTQYTQTAYRYGEEISIKEFLSEWNTVKTCWLGDVLPTPNTSSDAHSAMSEYVQLLIDKYDVPVTANSLHRVIDQMDINNDGIKETVIEFRDCEQLRGMYVFSADGKLIGELDLKGERYGTGYAIANINSIGARFSAGIYPYSNNSEKYYCFDTHRTGHKIDENGESCWLESETNRIVVNADGTLGSIAVMEENHKSKTFKINGKEVTQEELWAEQHKYYNSNKPRQGDPYIW